MIRQDARRLHGQPRASAKTKPTLFQGLHVPAKVTLFSSQPIPDNISKAECIPDLRNI
jgi:hypothetical protein